MSATLVSTKPVSIRYQLNWTVKGPHEVNSIDLQFPDEIPGHATLKLHLTGGYVGNGWVMSSDVVSGVSFSMTWSLRLWTVNLAWFVDSMLENSEL